MLSDVSFGQYYPAQSFVHKLDARAKILLLIAYIVMIFLCNNFFSLALCFCCVLCCIILSNVPILTVLKSIKAIIFIIILTFAINIFFYPATDSSTVLFWIVTLEGVTNAIYLACRLILLVIGSCILTLTTTPVNLTDAIESLLKPLKIIKFPVHELALIMSIALRFIPTLLGETDRIINAQKARGGDFESGNFIKRVKALVPILIPLLISAFRRAEELGDAMDARCYSGSANRTKFKKLVFSYRDVLATLFIAIVITGVVLVNFYCPMLTALIVG